MSDEHAPSDSSLGDVELDEAEIQPPLAAPLPALFHHCVTVYNAMFKQSVQVSEGHRYEGSLTALFGELGMGIANYTPIMKRLQSMNCARQLRRGGGPQPSIWLLITPPTEQAFRSADDSRIKKQRRGPGTAEQNAQQMRDINRRLSNVEIYLRRQGAEL